MSTLSDRTTGSIRARRTLRGRVMWGSALSCVAAAIFFGRPSNDWTGVGAASTMMEKADAFLNKRALLAMKSGTASIIVKMDGELTDKREAKLKGLGAEIYQRLPIINSVALRVPATNVPRLSLFPFVTRLSTDVMMKKCDEFTVGASGADTAFSQYKLTGNNVGVAVIDSGVRSSNDLREGLLSSSRIVATYDLVGNSGSGSDDTCGHGTHVAGIIGGNGAASTGLQYFRTFYGVARKVDIVSVRVLDANGQGTVSNVIAGIDWCVKNKSKYNIRVMNISAGHPVGESYTTDPLCQAVERAWKSGIVVVCAAGNMGRFNEFPAVGQDNEGFGTAYGSIQSPGNDPYVITVGAMKRTATERASDLIATYSSRGPSRVDLILKPDIVAPGNKVISLTADGSTLDTAYGGYNTIPRKDYSYTLSTKESSKYFRLSGTSMAAPVVSGAAALLIEADPSLTPDTVKARLMVSADKWEFPNGGGADPCTFGAGYLNIPEALKSRIVATQSAMSPQLKRNDDGTITVDADRAIWGNDSIWGTRVPSYNAIWGNNAIWGPARHMSSSQAIWGTSVWNDNAVWGVNTNSADMSSKTIRGE